MNNITKTAMITIVRTAQCGQVQPHQRPGGGEDRHRHQQAPDHPQPHLRRGEPGGHPVCVCWTPRACTRPGPGWGTTWSRWCGRAVADVDARGAAGGAHRPCGRAGGRACIERIRERGAALPCWCINKIDTVEKKEELLEVIAAYSAGLTAFTPSCPSPPRTGDGLEELLDRAGRSTARRGPSCSPTDMTTDQPERPGDAPRSSGRSCCCCLDKEIPHGTAVEITRFSERENEHHRRGRDHLLRKGQPQGHHHRQERGHAEEASAPWPGRTWRSSWAPRCIMETWVKVKENWRDNVNFIRSLRVR